MHYCRGDVQDRGVFHSIGEESSREQPGSFHVDLKRLEVLLDFVFQNRSCTIEVRGIGNEDIELAKCLADLRKCGFDGGLAADVGADSENLNGGRQGE